MNKENCKDCWKLPEGIELNHQHSEPKDSWRDRFEEFWNLQFPNSHPAQYGVVKNFLDQEISAARREERERIMEGFNSIIGAVEMGIITKEKGYMDLLTNLQDKDD